MKSLSFQLSGAQLGITVTSLLVGFIMEPTLGRAFNTVFEVVGLDLPRGAGVTILLALVVATASQMVFGELVPKNLAIAHPAGVAFAVVGPMRLINALWKPLVLFLNNSANWTVRRLGIEPQEELIPLRSLDELELLIRQSRAEGGLREPEYALLARSISFAEKTAADAMIPRVDTVALQMEAPVAELARLSLETGHSRFPVCEEGIDDIAGIAHIKDVHAIPIDRRDTTQVSEIVRDAIVVPESRPLQSLLLEMRKRNQQMAVVLDEYGGTAGIITVEDILEEIVGEIEDEYDRATLSPPPSVSPEGVHIVSGKLHRDEVRDATGFEMPEGDFETLGGFLLWRFDRIPEPGDHTEHEGWEFKVVEMDGRRVGRVLLVAPPASSDEEPS